MSPRELERGGEVRAAAMSTRTLTVALLLGLGACAPQARLEPPPRALALPAPIEAPPPAATPAAPAPLDAKTAAERAKAIASGWAEVEYGDEAARAAFLADPAHSEAELVAVLDGLTRDCAAGAEKCQPAEAADGARLIRLLGEVASAAGAATPALRLLVRLDTLGSWEATRAIDELLERRFLARGPVCKAPGAAAIAAADADLDDFFVIEEGKTPRALSSQERADLAYFYAAVDGSANWIGSVSIATTQPIAADHPDVILRTQLDAELKAALLRGDLEQHAKLGRRYLESLGYPGPIRAYEDAAPGTVGYSELMRDLARSLEILGELPEAAKLYRLPIPMRGCTMSMIDDELQIRGVIRTSEGPGGDCRQTAGMRLYSLDYSWDRAFGVKALEAGGYDVARLYRAALATQNRLVESDVKQRLEASPHASEGLARLARLGSEPWMDRLRAVRGFADSAGAGAVDTLLQLAKSGAQSTREEALGALGALLFDNGYDPCAASGVRHRFQVRSRQVKALSSSCKTKLAEPEVAAVATQLASLASDPEPRIRELVAKTLGHLASPAGKKALATLAKDKFENGEVCHGYGTPAQRCERNFPVRSAASEALEQLAEAEKVRAAARKAKPSQPAKPVAKAASLK